MNLRETAAEEARALAALDLQDLRARWRELYGPPPGLRSPELVRHLLAWRLQAERLGGLDPQVRRQLRQKSARADASPKLAEGAIIAREWQGRRYEVRAVDGGYLYDGAAYRSLSAVARAITGARWNGPRFFGLRAETAS